MQGLIGILGGMGPAATVDIFHKFVTFSTFAQRDQQHIPLLISSIPDIPDRSHALLQNGISPLNHLQRYFHLLEEAGAECIIIPCNTAHYWYDDLKRQARVEMISIIDSTISEISLAGYRNVGLLATDATVAGGIYQTRLAEKGITLTMPSTNQQQAIMRSIYLFKAGNVGQAHQLMAEAAQHLLQQGVEALICGCTEVPIILAHEISRQPERYIDATAALVRAAINWYHHRMAA